MKPNEQKLLTVSLLFVLLTVMFAAFGVKAQKTRELTLEEPDNKESRTALVIGNGNYTNSPLKNPPNDADDMTQALKTLGFEVLAYTNLDQNAMKKAIRDFGAKLRAKGGVGLFYYAGHGVQVKGVNYLIPVSAQVNTEEEVEYESVEVGLVMAQMEAAKNKMNIVILDACRNNPFARSFRSSEKGLASIDAPSGTLLAYSTAPGSVASDGAGRNGLYTQELLKAIKTGGLSIEDVFKRVRVSVRGATADKQTPWESSSLTGNFYFSGNRNSADSNKETKPDRSAGETAFWRSIENSTETQDFEDFLKEYPNGIYAPTARLKIRKLNEKTKPVNNQSNTVPQTTNQTPKTETNSTQSQTNFELKKQQTEEENRRNIDINNQSAKLLNEATTAFNSGNYDLAIAKYDEAYKLDPTWIGSAPALLTNKSITLINRGAKSYNDGIKNQDPEEGKRKIAAAKNDFRDAAAVSAEALKIFDNAIRTDGVDAVRNYQAAIYSAYFQRFEALRLVVQTGDVSRVRDFMTAYKEYAAVETDTPKKLKNQLTAANTLRLGGEYQAAAAEYQNVLAQDPDNLDALAGKGLSLLSDSMVTENKAKAKEAAVFLQRFVNLAPETHPQKAQVKGILEELKRQK